MIAKGWSSPLRVLFAEGGKFVPIPIPPMQHLASEATSVEEAVELAQKAPQSGTSPCPEAGRFTVQEQEERTEKERDWVRTGGGRAEKGQR